MAEISVAVGAALKAHTSTRARLPWGAWGLRGSALLYLVACALIPAIVIHVEGLRSGVQVFLESVTRPAALGAITLTLWTAALMALINMVMGTLTAYVLTAYRFPGKALVNLLIDLPFAIPTLVTGVMLVLLYGPQTALGGFLEKQLGVKVLFAPPGIVVALLFISFPFVVRAVQPALAQLDPDQENAAFTLGGSPWQTFWRVVVPAIRPAVITGGLLSFARALGEFGAVVIVAGNIPMRSQVAAVYIYAQVESGTPQAAASVSIVLLLIAFGVTLGIDLIQRRQRHA
ncbi:MAG TPA: sulfate ABC transporter permease subunit CysT [Aggregatilineaceae bacterium]|nr:sulfate ABC transporter permease subunit CysT [Aggregatilineaceae bacterium]